MKYLFLDESGELGFKASSSRYFIITLLACDEGEPPQLRKKGLEEVKKQIAIINHFFS